MVGNSRPPSTSRNCSDRGLLDDKTNAVLETTLNNPPEYVPTHKKAALQTLHKTVPCSIPVSSLPSFKVSQTAMQGDLQRRADAWVHHGF